MQILTLHPTSDHGNTIPGTNPIRKGAVGNTAESQSDRGRSDSITGLEPIEERRGPGRRNCVFIQDVSRSIIASRSENAMLRDLVETPGRSPRRSITIFWEIQGAIGEINPPPRSIIRNQGKWDLDRLEERIREMLEED